MAEAVPMAMNSRRGLARVSTRKKDAVIVNDILFWCSYTYGIHTMDGVRMVLLYWKSFVGWIYARVFKPFSNDARWSMNRSLVKEVSWDPNYGWNPRLFSEDDSSPDYYADYYYAPMDVSERFSERLCSRSINWYYYTIVVCFYWFLTLE